MSKHFIRAALVIGALLVPGAVEGQSALQIVRQLEALEARLGQLEGDVSAASDRPAAPATVPSEVSGAIADMRAEIGRLAGEVAAVRATTEQEDGVEAQLQALAEELAALKASLAAAAADTANAEAADSTVTIEQDLAAVLAEVRTYMEAAAEREAATKQSPLSFSGRVQAQYSTTSAPDVIASDFVIRRARLEAELRISDVVSGRLQPDFGAGRISLTDAFVALDFDPAFAVAIGQFKRPFDLFELTSSTRILTIEREGIVRGSGSCAGPGGICSYSRFTQKLGFADRDIGVRFDGAAGDWNWEAAVTNGAGANSAEDNDSKSFGGRLVFGGLANLSIAANAAAHDYTNDVDPTRKHAAGYGGDVEWGTFSSGWHAQAGVVAGDNWLDLDAAGTPSRFRSAQGILSYKRPLRLTGIEAVEPLARLSWGDPNAALGGDEEVFATAGIVAHFIGRNKLALNVERWMPPAGTAQWSVKVQSYLHF
jgi:outer membrane murein-binding lipoprotein Lpp